MTRQVNCSVLGCTKRHHRRGYCEAHFERLKRWGNPLGGRTPEGEPHRFLQEAVLQYRGGKCLTWPYGRDGNGYGIVHFSAGAVRVHRYVCEVVNGAAPSPDHQAAHLCGKGLDGCCSPAHMAWKTQTEIEADKLIRGTRAYQKGEMHGRAKLTEFDIVAIRKLAAEIGPSAIARRFKVAPSTISLIVSRQRWGHL